ncbi:phage virion morphogenesis protein [Sandaracinus amylolyticus]|uniref:Phage virion morphogenesis protein n=1 Tax=Sandaracinus amylolyticus TaxID=927083 RepID=A0A0F6W6T1_9BACT|nr:phage virion morphogenesis protein [Sandaracinus amylolyticus]AKF08886.1 hypothetical protein DB32_006035 [Sandaracinus amylolyticus]
MTQLRVTGIDDAIRTVRSAAERARDLSPILRVIAEDTKTLVDDSFDQSRSPSGAPFAPLAPATKARRRKGSSKPLVDTGRLRNSVSASAAGNLLSVGTNVVYGATHQYGSKRVPARPFLPFAGDPAAPVLEMSGPAGDHWRAVAEQIREYIITGRIT